MYPTKTFPIHETETNRNKIRIDKTLVILIVGVFDTLPQ